MKIENLLESTPVVPVITIHDANQAVPLAQAMIRGGLHVLEITLRSDAALESIRRIAAEVSQAIVGAGTVTTPEDLDQAREAGARFAVSPGLTPRLAAAATAAGLPFLPGVMTTSEAMAAREHGFSVLKLFPATVAGGMDLLNAIQGPLPDLKFCPTGGVTAENFHDFLALPNVICVGGSWVAPWAAVASGDWNRITALARDAVEAGAAS